MANSELKAKTAKGLFWGGLGNGIQQVLTLCFGIFLARLLDPKDYGMVGMLAIFSAVAGVLLDGGFAAAIINKQDAKSEDYNAVFWFNVAMGVSLYLILFFCAPLIAGFFHTPALVPLARFVFLGFLVGCTGTVHGAIIVKRLMIKQKIVISSIALLVSGVVGVLMAFNGMAYWGIATQTLLYLVILTALTWYISPWRPQFQFRFKPLREMLPFSIKIALTNVFNQVNLNILSTLLGKFYTVKEVGYYVQGNKWMLMGSNFVTSMENSVAQPVMATMASEIDRQRNAFRKMLRFISFVAFPAMLGLALIAPELITITITAKWLPSVAIMQLLCLWGAIIPINNLYSNMVVSRGKSNIYLWNTIGIGSCQLIAMIVASAFSIRAMIIAFIIINVAWIGVWNIFAWREIRLPFFDVLRDIIPFLGAAIISIAPAYWLTLGMGIYASLFLKIAVTAAIYVTIMWLSRSVIFRESIQFISQKFHKHPIDNAH